MKSSLHIRINGEPRGKERPRFTKQGRAYTPKERREYEAQIREAALNAAAIQQYTKPSADCPVQVHIDAYFTVPKSYSLKKCEKAKNGLIYPTKKPDADNIGKLICDALNEIAYHDDKQVADMSVSKRYAPDGEPYVDVTVTPLDVQADETKQPAL